MYARQAAAATAERKQKRMKWEIVEYQHVQKGRR
jgi:hypothetical protein